MTPSGYLLNLLCDGKAEAEVYSLVFGSEEWKRWDAGLLNREEAAALMLEKAHAVNRSFEVQAVLDDWMRMLKPIHRTLELIRRLKKMGYKIYYHLNISAEALEHLQNQEFFSLFNGGVASCRKLHLSKPDPAFTRR